uniref:Uncharacterized protein n=1 Tax=uncultured prokaryote TaxID=198431 RepID=A0A0H5QNN3_9ZZZZ|nr:hypothetical protein [uncultured prokaryote]
MTKPKVTYEGLGLHEKSLTVFLSIGDTGAKRMRTLTIPAEVFTSPEMISWVNSAVNRRLRAAWEHDEPFIRGWE